MRRAPHDGQNPRQVAPSDSATPLEHVLFALKHEEPQLPLLLEETRFIQAYDRAFERIDRAFNLPNRTLNLLIQWVRQNGGQMPLRRRNAPELEGLQPAQIDHIAAIVAECFSEAEPKDGQATPHGDNEADGT